MKRIWYEGRWFLAVCLLSWVLRLIEREATPELLKHFQAMLLSMEIDHYGGGIQPQPKTSEEKRR